MSKKTKPKKQVVQHKEPSKLKRFATAVRVILKNEKDTENRFTAAALSFLITCFLNFIALILAIYGIMGVFAGIWTIFTAIPHSVTDIVLGINISVFSIAAGLLALVLRGMANEAGRETDTNYLVALFSGLTGFAGLVVAVIALVKG